MTRHSEHQGRVVAVKDHKGVYTIGYVAACGTCDWQSTEMRERGESTLRDLFDHIESSRPNPQPEGATT